MHLYGFLIATVAPEININAIDENQMSPLSISLYSKNIDLTEQILFDFKDRISFRSQRGEHHPLMITVKGRNLALSRRLLSIMKKNPSPDWLNLKDDMDSSLLHYLFMQFNVDMENAFVLCQEFLQSGCINLNQVNKQGLSAIDAAIETKQNSAVELAVCYNQGKLPGVFNFRSKFDLNISRNSKKLTPMHRAISNSNYNAIYLLLTSRMVNILQKDKEFRTARDYCQKVLFLYKYLKRGEIVYLRVKLKEGHVKQILESSRVIEP